MLYKDRILLYGMFFLLAHVTSSCKQQPGKPADETQPVHISELINDSAALSVDKSPMDMIYFPADYPKDKMMSAGTAEPIARIIYSRPQKNGRIIFADSSVTGNFIQHYGKEWRLGANESTEVEFFRDVTVNGKKLDRGRYIMYCIPYPGKWKIIFNSNLFSWGLHMDKTKDITETEVPVVNDHANTEFFTMSFENAAGGCNLIMLWGDMKVIIPVRFS